MRKAIHRFEIGKVRQTEKSRRHLEDDFYRGISSGETAGVNGLWLRLQAIPYEFLETWTPET